MTQKKQNEILNYLYMLESMGYEYHQDISLPQNQIVTTTLPDHLENLQNIIDNCNLCNLHKLKTSAQTDYINPNSKIVFISLYRLKQKEILENMVQNVLKIPYEQITLLSIIKCDSSDENSKINENIDICKHYILKQLEILAPKLIVTLGDSYKYILNSSANLSTIHGATLQYNQIDTIPIYDPEILVKNPSLKKDTFNDLQKIKLLLEKLI